MTTTSSDSCASSPPKRPQDNRKEAIAGRATRRFEINSHRDGAVFKVRYREGSIAKRCLLDQA